MNKIVALDGYTLNPGDLSWNDIGEHGELEVFNRSTIAEAIDRVDGAHVIIVNKFVLDKDFLQYCNALKLVCVSATGYNNVDLNACREKNISVCNVANYSTPGVAQHTFGLLLHWRNQVSRHNSLVKKGYWSICPDFSFTAQPIHELHEKVFGLLGYGDIAKQVGKIALAFGMRVLVCRHSDKPLEDTQMQKVDLDTLLKSSDVLSLHASLNENTHEIINANTLAKMKSGAILINTSRGGLINEKDLSASLTDHHLEAALLDVLCEEPAPLDHPLYDISNCIITPHIAWASVESRQRLMKSIEENIAAFFAGNPNNLIN